MLVLQLQVEHMPTNLALGPHAGTQLQKSFVIHTADFREYYYTPFRIKRKLMVSEFPSWTMCSLETIQVRRASGRVVHRLF